MLRANITLVLLLAPLLLGPLSVAHGQQWITYRPSGEGYSVELPGQPTSSSKEIKTDVGAIRMTIASLEAGSGVGFVAINSVLPEVAAGGDVQEKLDAGRDRMIASMKGNLREEKRTTIGGVPARMLIIDVPSQKRVTVGLYVVAGVQTYQVVCSVPAGQEGMPAVQRFIRSFSLVAQ